MSNIERETPKIQELLQKPDFTRPESEVNPVNLVMGKIIHNFVEAETFPKTEIVYGNSITTVEQNFDNLFFPSDSIMRTSLHTQFLSDGRILRTQMSYLLADTLKQDLFNGDRLIFCPGLVFRREGIHHQMDIWYLKRSSGQLTPEHVTSLLNLTVKGLIPESERNIKPKSLYYIENGYKLKAPFQGELKTFLDGGIITPQMFINAGLNPNEYTGIAIGVSLDRLTMYVKGISDPRVLRSLDPRIKRQLANLEPFKEVSKFPAIARDLSVCVEKNISLKDIEFVLDFLLDDDTRATIEELNLLSEDEYGNIPVSARERLNIQPNQKNLLIRFVLRSLERTLTKQEGNDMRNSLFNIVNNLNREKVEELRRLSQDS